MNLRKVLTKFINIGSLGLMSFFVFVVLGILISFNSLPGDTTYPLKISLEQMAVFVSQVHPPTEMELRLVVLNRRYQEALELLEEDKSARGYKYFSDAASSAKRAILGVGDEYIQSRYREKLAEDLRRYNAELEYLIQELETP